VRDANGGRYSTLAVGQRVRFEVGRNLRSDRTYAVNVVLLDPIVSAPEAFFRDDEDGGGPMPLSDAAFMREPRS
jgi:hypothetical protein